MSRVTAAVLALVLLPAGLSILYAADAHPPDTQRGCGIALPDERGTVHLNQDGTVDYTFLCTSAKYAGEAFVVLNLAGLTMTAVGLENLSTAVRG